MATACFFERIINMSKADCDQDHMEILIHNKPGIPKRVEYILGMSEENPGPVLAEVARGLQQAGAQMLAMPCVTAHYFYEEIAASVDIPMLNMVDETVKYLKGREIRSVGILGTQATVQSGFLQKKLGEQGIRALAPSQEGQEKINHLIFKELKVNREPDVSRLYEAAQELLEAGAQRILLSCTDLSILGQRVSFPSQYLDLMDILAMRAVEECGRLKANPGL